MYCLECKCEYGGWTGRCPECKSPLVEEVQPEIPDVTQTISYDELVEIVRESDGEYQVALFATSIAREKKWRFPYNGYGYAWTKKMSGASNGISIELTTSEMGRDTSWGFPYMGYGFAWAKSLVGSIGGTEVKLQATKVAREKKWRFPYLGYGRAWTEELRGELGDQLHLHLQVTEVGKGRDWRFPYRGYGFGWEKKATLTISLAQ